MGMFNSSWFRVRDDTASRDVIAMPQEAIRHDAPTPISMTLTGDPVWVIYASETGVAEHLANDAFRALQRAGVVSRLLPFDELVLETLEATSQALFLVSTCYDGDPPDMAEEFCRDHMGQPVKLSQLRYGMLALGDSYYDEFCGFGRRLHQWLQASGAQTLFEPIEMDDEDEVAARRWHENLGTVVRLCQADGSPVA